jgi:hypothetical protein
MVHAPTQARASSAPIVLSTDLVAQMTPQQQASYFQQLPSDVATLQGAAIKKLNNRRYMLQTKRKYAMALTNGATTQSYNAGQALTFNLPTANNAFAEGIVVHLHLPLTFAAGTSAVYSVNACGILGVIDNIIIQYNKTQIRMRPQVLRHYSMLRGALMPVEPGWTPIGGQSDATIIGWVGTGANPGATINPATNTYEFEFYLPFNAISPLDIRGLLPMMQGETAIQAIITCAPSLLGNDPILNTFSAKSGSGHAVTVGSATVAVEAVYRDGDVLGSPNRLGVDLTAADGTTQWQIDAPLTNIAAGAIYRQKLTIMGRHAYVILLAVDGQQATQYSTISNLQYLEFAKDSVGANVFEKWGIGSNLDVREYFGQVQRQLQQALDEGVIPLVYGPTANVPDPDALEGMQYLDNTPNGWTDARYGLQFSAVNALGGAGMARVEPHVIYVNPTGLIPV